MAIVHQNAHRNAENPFVFTCCLLAQLFNASCDLWPWMLALSSSVHGNGFMALLGLSINCLVRDPYLREVHRESNYCRREGSWSSQTSALQVWDIQQQPARTTRRIWSFICRTICIQSLETSVSMYLGQVNLKVSSAFPHISLSVVSCLPSAASAREQLGKENTQQKEQLGPAPASPIELLVLEHHLQLQSA